MYQTYIELTEKVALELLKNRKIDRVDYEHLPFKEFTIKYPMRVYLSTEQAINDTLAKVQYNKRVEDITADIINDMRKYASDYTSKNVRLEYSYNEGEPHITLYDPLDSKLFEMKIMLGIPVTIENNFAKESLPFAIGLIVIITNILAYIQKPREEVIVQSTKEYQKRGTKGGKSSGKSYIYKKIYKVMNFIPNTEKRDYHRTVESWGVRGHWRTYKSGRKVWIKEHSKGKKDGSGQQVYRITKTE